jgi:uroporphyrinogen decarboxylase
MNSRERLLSSLAHKEPDRVPIDMGGTHVSGIHVRAYKALVKYLGLKESAITMSDTVQQLALPSEEMLEKLGIDTRGLFPLCSHNWNIHPVDTEAGRFFTDEWQLTHFMPREDGHWWTVVSSPLASRSLGVADIEAFPWPAAADPRRIAGLRDKALLLRAQGKPVVLKGLCAGIFEMGQRLRGMENFMMDLLTEPDLARALIHRLAGLKVAFWEMALAELGDVVDVVLEADDYGSQESQLISPDLFRQLFKEPYREVMGAIRRKLEAAKDGNQKGYVLFHSCGNIRPIIPDFIEIGIDAINPVHVTAAGMEPTALKRDFGNDLSFWGGGIETQSVLPLGTLQDIEQNVRKNLDALMPGGGYVFNAIHNIQGEVPPRNIVKMIEAVKTYGDYSRA